MVTAMFTRAFGVGYLCAAADRHNDPVTLRETTSAIAVRPITRAPDCRAHYRRAAAADNRDGGNSPSEEKKTMVAVAAEATVKMLVGRRTVSIGVAGTE